MTNKAATYFSPLLYTTIAEDLDLLAELIIVQKLGQQRRVLHKSLSRNVRWHVEITLITFLCKIGLIMVTYQIVR